MKKLLTTAGVLVVVMLGLFTAHASAKGFSDSSRFASWYANAAAAMQNNNIITGYADGTFRGEASVTRAELAVMLERLAKALGKELRPDPKVCTMEYRYGLTLYIYDQNGNAVTDAKVTAVSGTGDTISFETSGEAGRYTGVGEGKGYYNVTVEKAGYTTHRETYRLEHDGCHVLPQLDTVLLIKRS